MSIIRARLHDLFVLGNADRSATNFPDPHEGAVFFEVDTGDAFIWVQGDWEPLGSGGGGAVSSVFGRTGAVVAQANDYTWAQIDKTVSDIADIATRSHTSLTDIGSNTHAQIDSHISSTLNPHGVTAAQANALAIANNLSDLNSAATARTNLGLVSGGAGDIWVEKAGDTMTGTLAISAGGLSVEGGVVFNDSGADADFRVEGDTNPDMIFVDASNDSMSFGTSTQDGFFNIGGDIATTGTMLTMQGTADPGAIASYIGIRFVPFVEVSGAATFIFGQANALNLSTGSANVTNAINAQFQVRTRTGYTGTVTRAIALNIADSGTDEASASITSNFGIRVQRLGEGTSDNHGIVLQLRASDTGAYAIYSEQDAPSWHRGVFNVGGGAAAASAGALNVAGHVAPVTDDTYDIGTASFRWDDIYATNSTIQTSDARVKIDVEDSELGLDFIEMLRPVSYKFAPTVVEIPVIDVTEDGEKTFRTEYETRVHTRPHQGMIAQEVKRVIDEIGVDFAGYVHDEGSDTYGLRYGEFVAPLVKAVQELSARVKTLEAQLGV